MGGLALSYAAANKGNNKAATRAREAAYMEVLKLPDTSFDNPKPTNLIHNPNEKSEFTLYSNRSKEDLPKNGVRFKAAVSGNNSKNDNEEPSFDSTFKADYPKNSMIAEIARRESEKNNNHKLSAPVTTSLEDIRKKNDNFTYKTSDGTEITPSNEVMKFLEDYYSEQYNVGKTTTDIVVNEAQLEALHKYLSNGIKNMERPSNIGVGAWNKQMQTDLKWIDDMFGKSSNFSKALKTLPAITIGIDTIRGISENVKNKTGIRETVSDAVIDIGLGAGGAYASGKVGAAVGSSISPGIGTVAGIAAGLAIGFATEGINIKGKSPKEWLDVLVDSAIDGVKNGLNKELAL